MEKEKQKLVGYIIYDTFTYKVSMDYGKTYEKKISNPEMRRKVYNTLGMAQGALENIKKCYDSNAYIIPVYADPIDLDKMEKDYIELKKSIED
jgi:hypothetical protein